MSNKLSYPKKYFSRYKKPLVPIPNLVKDQIDSFNWLVEKGLKEVFDEFSSIKDFSEKKFELDFIAFELEKPHYDEYYAKDKKLSYEAPLKVTVRLKNKTTGTEKDQEIFMADFPIITPHGTFIVSGIERVIVPQLARSFGVFFTSSIIKGATFFGAKIIPSRGAWIEIETEADKSIFVRIDRKRKFPVTALLRAFLPDGKAGLPAQAGGAETDEAIFELFKSNPAAKEYI
ncbi:MAG: DNA-directed RNA polymerase subunit beta, partial [Patescibacteria group bacterium]